MLHDLDRLPAVVLLLAGAVLSVLLLREIAHLPLLAWEPWARWRGAKGENCLLGWWSVLLPLERSVVTTMMNRVGVG